MNEIIEKALDSINLENYYISKGTEEKECAVYTYLEYPKEYADNTKKCTEYSILVNLYVEASRIEELKESVIGALNKAGIKGGRVQQPHKEKNLYNVAISFNASIRN